MTIIAKFHVGAIIRHSCVFHSYIWKSLCLLQTQNSVIPEYEQDRSYLSTYQRINVLQQSPKFHNSKFTRFFSDNGEEEINQKVRVLPRRLVKRLKKQNITESEFLIKLDVSDRKNNPDVKPPESEMISINSKEELEKLLETTEVVQKIHSETELFPSDIDKLKPKKNREYKSPKDTSIILFPGQGSQFVGMGEKLLPYKGVENMYDQASYILGYDLLDLCLNGPKEKLDKTECCQPAILVTSLAAIERLKQENPLAVENCVSTAGFSVGEFAALVFGGVLSFEDAVKLVKVRGEAMQKASESVDSGMMTVIAGRQADFKGATALAKEYCEIRHHINEPVCTVANWLFTGCKVLAGHSEGLEFIAANRKKFNLLKTKRLPVSGAFHTVLMNPAVRPFEKAFEGINLNAPKLPIYSNARGHIYHKKAHFQQELKKQLTKPVLWEQIMHNIYKRDKGSEFPQTYEVGPGRQLGAMLRSINKQAHLHYHDIEV